MKEKEKNTHGIQLLIRTVVRDPSGKIISDSGHKPAKSFVIQFLELLYCWFSAKNEVTQDATQIDGTEDDFYLAGRSALVKFLAGVNEGTYGVVIGTGDTAETNMDHALETKIAEGAGATQMTHAATIVGAAGVVGANVDLVITRPFTNNSGGSITVKEAGLYFENNMPATDYIFCIVRDVLSPAVAVPDKCSLMVYYTLRTTV